MARRSGVPADVRRELPLRANAGVGLDPEFPTTIRDGRVCRAAVACHHRPSKDMLLFAKQVMDYVDGHGGMHVRIQQDFRDRGQPGALLVMWSGGPDAAEVAEQFAVSTTEDGTPRVPAWLSLRVDDVFDMRWQPAY